MNKSGRKADQQNSISYSSLNLSMSPLAHGIYTPHTKSIMESQKKSQENWHKRKIKQDVDHQTSLVS